MSYIERLQLLLEKARERHDHAAEVMLVARINAAKREMRTSGGLVW